jgi:hypothetical protein
MKLVNVVSVGALVLTLAGALAALAPRDPHLTGANPFADSALPPAQRYRFAGVVSQRLAAGSYTYLLVEPATGPAAWVVTLGKGAPAHTNVSVLVVGRARDFKSARLARTFSQLLFGVVRRTEAKAPLASTLAGKHSNKEQ